MRRTAHRIARPRPGLAVDLARARRNQRAPWAAVEAMRIRPSATRDAMLAREPFWIGRRGSRVRRRGLGASTLAARNHPAPVLCFSHRRMRASRSLLKEWFSTPKIKYGEARAEILLHVSRPRARRAPSRASRAGAAGHSRRRHWLQRLVSTHAAVRCAPARPPADPMVPPARPLDGAEGPKSRNPLAFSHYNADEVRRSHALVMARRQHCRRSVWHSHADRSHSLARLLCPSDDPTRR